MTTATVADNLGRMTLDEKLALLAGVDLWHTTAIDRLAIPSLRVTDGPHGARGADGNHGPSSVSFPAGVAMGATWNPSLIEQVGRALAGETAAKGAQVLLGPTVNIPRVPNAGRNFECFSEDPLLSGLLAAAWIVGLQSEGIGACIKHFVCNDQEQDRYDIDAMVDERALREIFLEPFRIAVEEAGPWAVMSAYNSVNGTTASEHPLLDEVLRYEFGFDGLVMSDWFGTYGPGVAASGLDLEMPGPARWMSPARVRDALQSGVVSEEQINGKVRRLLALIERTTERGHQTDGQEADARSTATKLAREVATQSIVLLLNDGQLPLEAPERIAVIGELAAETPHQGGGSSSVSADHVVSILDGIRSIVGEEVDVTWSPGSEVRRFPPAIEAASLAAPGFTVEYFDGIAPVGVPVRSISSNRCFLGFFGTGDEWVDYDRFSIRMSGRFIARRGGTHRFRFTAGGRLRVHFGSETVVDQWGETDDAEGSVTVDLPDCGTVELVVEYASVPGVRWRWLGLGCDVPGPEVSIESAVEAAAAADVAVVVAGLTAQWESEGFDRPDLKLPGRQDDLIAAVAAEQPNTVVVLTAGSAVEMPWADDVGGVMQAWYGGQEVGHAVADVLFGRRDPGGRLPITIPMTSRQHPGLLNYPGEAGVVRYGEGVHVGYRGFDRLDLPPRFPFGYGLSYTEFRVGSVVCSPTSTHVAVQLEVENVGAVAGVEVVQVFACQIGGVARRLVGFEKVHIADGHAAEVGIDIPLDRFRWWDAAADEWHYQSGAVELSIRGSFGTHATSVELAPTIPEGRIRETTCE